MPRSVAVASPGEGTGAGECGDAAPPGGQMSAGPLRRECSPPPAHGRSLADTRGASMSAE